MADNDQNNEEFKFEDMDSLNSQEMGDFDSGTENANFPNQDPASGKKDVKKNAMIAIGVVVGLMVIYKVIVFMIPDKTEPDAIPSMPSLAVTQQQPEVEVKIDEPVVEPIAISAPVDNNLNQKVAAIELSQDVMKSQVNAMSDKVTGVNETINTLNAQIMKLNQTIEALNNQVIKQSSEINQLIVRNQPKRPKVVAKTHYEKVIYYIKAVIPGRAWLIATNGSTLTVREGTHIPGYGLVKMIDSTQGRVITNSGKIIRFSQEDS